MSEPAKGDGWTSWPGSKSRLEVAEKCEECFSMARPSKLVPVLGGPHHGHSWICEDTPEIMWAALRKPRGRERPYALYKFDGKVYRFVRCAVPSTDAGLKAHIFKGLREELTKRGDAK